MVAVGTGKSADPAAAPTSVALFDQGLVQVLQAAVTGLQPKQPYVLGLVEPARRQRHYGRAGELHD